MQSNPWVVTFVLIVVLLAVVAEGAARSNDHPVSTVFYHGVPINIDLRVNEESRIHLEESVEIGLPHILTSKLDVASVHGIVYLTARQTFTRQRVALKGSQTGRFVLLDVSASTDAPKIEDLSIRTGNPAVASAGSPSMSPAKLLRVVAKLTLTPLLPKSGSSGIQRVSMTLDPQSIYRGFGIDATLLSAWRSEKWLALVVELRNTTGEAIRLSPRDLRGLWHSAGFVHTRLLPHGKRGAQTVLFLVGAHDALAELR